MIAQQQFRNKTEKERMLEIMLIAFLFTCRGLRNALRVVLASPLLAPLRLTSLCQITCSEAGCVEHDPARLPSFLRRNFAVRSESNGGSCARLPAGLRLGAGPLASRRSPSLTNTLRTVLRLLDRFCDMTWKGTHPEREGEGTLGAAVRLGLHREIEPQESAKARVGVVLCTPHRRGLDLSKQGEAQRGQRGISDVMQSRLIPDLCISGPKLIFKAIL
jgi:hypothetical protein